MSGLENIPYRIPQEWDPKWFLDFIKDVLAKADVRNSLGVGITIEGESDELATLSNDSQDNDFVMVTASANQDNERVLAAGTLTEIVDNGAGNTIEVRLADIATSSFLGRSTATSGDVEVLTGTQATALLDFATTLLQGVVLQTAAVADLSQTISDPPTQTEVQDLSDKVDELLAAMRTSGQLDT